ncbi:MAG: FAD-dependent oxidoreductase [Bacteroidales bacterium]|nr:FAD-dependent oxidoreductase [Bacteroidales bacterium]
MDRKIGIFICSGCDIGKSIDISRLKAVAEKHGAAFCREHPALCSKNGTDFYYSELENKELHGVVIAACSPRSKAGMFDHDRLLTERVNLREQVSWVMEPGHQDTQSAAEDYLRMGIARVAGSARPVPFRDSYHSSEILVVGAGITGLTAALEADSAGYVVHLVEKADRPGGYASKLAGQIPYKEPFNRIADPVIFKRIEELGTRKNINLYIKTTIATIKGQPGNFEVTLHGAYNGTIRVGAIVTAMGMKPYDPSALSHLGYGRLPGVLTSVEFEELIATRRYSEIPGRVLFIQCADSRDREHLPYCSNTCCGTTLKQATYIREHNPSAEVYIIYKDIRTPGLQEKFYRAVQGDDAIMMTKGAVTGVNPNGNQIDVEVKDSLIDEQIVIPVDMVVLAVGMVPTATEDLNLQYRQGTGLPELKYRFPDSHFICFPYETRRTGIYAAGTIRAPMDIPSCMADASGAVFKAIQCIEAVKRGEAVHPRSGDLSWPELYMDRCTDCKRCTEECPFGSYDENEKGTPIPNPARCRRCGICIGSCPERVISFKDYSINMMTEVIKAVHIPDEFEEKPRILAFVCENDAYPAFDMAGIKRLSISPYVRIIPVRCIGSVNKVWISDALSLGFDGILQIGCKPGEDYQCHYIHGSELTEKRGKNLQETLETMMLEPERIKTVFLEINEYDKIPGIINDYLEEIELIGPNPFKGM